LTCQLTAKQLEAQKILAGNATYIQLEGGSRSGKTFLLTRAVVTRGVKAPQSRHAILRLRFNHVKASIVLDTFPKVMDLCYPEIKYTMDKTDWYATLHHNDSQIWFGGLDDKQRTEKILGMEYATIYLNEISQIPFASRELAVTRLAQKVDCVIKGIDPFPLKCRMYQDCNPPKKSHWSYKLFHEKRDPDSKLPLTNPLDYEWMQINPQDNLANISPEYLKTLESLTPRMRRRFLEGLYTDDVTNGLFNSDIIETYRKAQGALPDMVRIAIGVDPSGSGDEDNTDNDEIGIVIVGLGVDGNAYLLEDCTVKAGPGTWGKVVGSAYDRHEADVVVGEVNYGGAMVGFVVQTARPRTNFKAVTASRGKVVRAEPFSALYESGKIRHAGYFPELEDEIVEFTTNGYLGDKSPNRADALFWALTELFPGIVNNRKANAMAPVGSFDFKPLSGNMGY
jgi:PBSX family phage terminase large subunit